MLDVQHGCNCHRKYQLDTNALFFFFVELSTGGTLNVIEIEISKLIKFKFHSNCFIYILMTFGI